MILFKPEHVEKILNRTKWQTRRVSSTGKKRWNVGSTHLAKTKMLSKEYFAKLEILAVYPEAILDISEADAVAEGYPGKAAYLEAFCRINKLTYEDLVGLMVFVVKFQVVS